MHTIKWKTIKDDYGKILIGEKDGCSIRIMEITCGRWSYFLYDTCSGLLIYMPSTIPGTVTTWPTKQIAKSEGVIKMASYQKESTNNEEPV